MLQSLALIPARGGSTGVPNKNKRLFAGRSLTSWAVDIGLQTCSRTFVSTDDKEIAQIALFSKAEYIDRPEHLSLDETPMLSVVKHALLELHPWKPDVVVLLQPTSPLRTPQMVQDALRMLDEDLDLNIDSVASVAPIPAHWSPDLAMTLSGAWLRPQKPSVARRQDARTYYCRDGSVYATRRRVIRGNSLYGTHCAPLYVDPKESVSIDTEEDWILAEALFKSKRNDDGFGRLSTKTEVKEGLKRLARQ